MKNFNDLPAKPVSETSTDLPPAYESVTEKAAKPSSSNTITKKKVVKPSSSNTITKKKASKPLVIPHALISEVYKILSCQMLLCLILALCIRYCPLLRKNWFDYYYDPFYRSYHGMDLFLIAMLIILVMFIGMRMSCCCVKLYKFSPKAPWKYIILVIFLICDIFIVNFIVFAFTRNKKREERNYHILMTILFNMLLTTLAVCIASSQSIKKYRPTKNISFLKQIGYLTMLILSTSALSFIVTLFDYDRKDFLIGVCWSVILTIHFALHTKHIISGLKFNLDKENDAIFMAIYLNLSLIEALPMLVIGLIGCIVKFCCPCCVDWCLIRATSGQATNPAITPVAFLPALEIV